MSLAQSFADAQRPRINGVPRLVPRMDPALFWTAVDDDLAAIGQAPAAWLEELAAPYAAGKTVHATVLMVLAGRRCVR